MATMVKSSLSREVNELLAGLSVEEKELILWQVLTHILGENPGPEAELEIRNSLGGLFAYVVSPVRRMRLLLTEHPELLERAKEPVPPSAALPLSDVLKNLQNGYLSLT